MPTALESPVGAANQEAARLDAAHDRLRARLHGAPPETVKTACLLLLPVLAAMPASDRLTPQPAPASTYACYDLLRASGSVVRQLRAHVAVDGSVPTLHLCEAPGGFVVALQTLLPTGLDWTAISLHSPDRPGFALPLRKARRRNGHARIVAAPGSHGDVTDTATADALLREVGTRSQVLVTCDGCGPAPSLRAWAAAPRETSEAHEHASHPLLCAQLHVALQALRPNGSAVVAVAGLQTRAAREVVHRVRQHFATHRWVRPSCQLPCEPGRYLLLEGFDEKHAPATVAWLADIAAADPAQADLAANWVEPPADLEELAVQAALETAAGCDACADAVAYSEAMRQTDAGLRELRALLNPRTSPALQACGADFVARVLHPLSPLPAPLPAAPENSTGCGYPDNALGHDA